MRLLVLVAALALLTPALAAADAASDYQTFCRSCHGDAGKGDGFAASSIPMPDFTSAAFQSGRDDARLRLVIREGGKAVGGSPMMMAYGKKLSAERIDELVKLIRAFGGP